MFLDSPVRAWLIGYISLLSARITNDQAVPLDPSILKILCHKDGYMKTRAPMVKYERESFIAKLKVINFMEKIDGED